jgi:hypothetical protein
VTKLGPRLRKLEAGRPVGCPTCRAWCGTVLQDDDGVRSRPERCPACGRFVPIRVAVHVVGVPLSVL